MNRYFYVPVMDSCIKHDGVALRDHLRVVDKELYESECDYFDMTYDLEFDDGLLNSYRFNKADRMNQKIEDMYEERNLPRSIVIVYNDGRFYEMASEEEIDPIELGNIGSFEILGVEVVEVFMDHPKYTPYARNFFDMYEKKKDLPMEKQESSVKQKVLQRFPFLAKRNS